MIFLMMIYGRNFKFGVKIISFWIKMKCTQKFKRKICNFLHCGQINPRLGKEKKKKKKKRVKIDKARSSKKIGFSWKKSCSNGKGGRHGKTEKKKIETTTGKKGEKQRQQEKKEERENQRTREKEDQKNEDWEILYERLGASS